MGKDTSYTEEDLKEHLATEHKHSAFATYLREIVYGGSDGIVTTFAVVAGFTGAQAGEHALPYTFLTVLLFGLANLFADGTSMGLGNYLSVRSAQDVYKGEKEKELQEIEGNPDIEQKETEHILKKRGYSAADAATLASLYRKNPSYWLDFMMNYELELPNPEGENPYITGLMTFVSFLFFGFLPLFPYALLQRVDGVFAYAALAAFGALVLLGILRWRVTKEPLVRSVGEVVLLGGVSGGVAFLVGTFFRA